MGPGSPTPLPVSSPGKFSEERLPVGMLSPLIYGTTSGEWMKITDFVPPPPLNVEFPPGFLKTLVDISAKHWKNRRTNHTTFLLW